MRIARQILWGLSIALFSSGIILGSLSLSLAEGDMAALLPTMPLPLSPSPTFPPFTPPVGTTSIPIPPTETFTPFVVTPPTNCTPPAGWLAYLVQPGDTLEGLAERYRIPSEQLSQANCLMTASLLPGSYLYVPPVPTRTPVPCGAPSGWIRYTILKGDTLYSLAQYYQVTVQQLQRANCMGSSTILITGKQIYVPPMPTRTPPLTFTPSLTLTLTSTLTPTPSPVTPSATPLPATATPTASDTPTQTPTNSPVPTATYTPITTTP
ncbi:LysM peptidoglycan-binding domain-containing protein [bacterium]|nr:LysM peptidoglycan-binding domain-containing protein [bacterium]